ncbi:MAG: inositol phosphate phosphatase SopB [Endozoicomonas sp.]
MSTAEGSRRRTDTLSEMPVEQRQRLATRTAEVLDQIRRPRSAHSTTSSASESSLESSSITSLQKAERPKSVKRPRDFQDKKSALAEKYRKLRSENRKKIDAMVDLKNPASLGATLFQAITKQDPRLALLEFEAEYLQEEMCQHLEPHINRPDFDSWAASALTKVIKGGGIASGFFPKLDQWHRAHSRNSEIPMSLSKLSIPKELENPPVELKMCWANTHQLLKGMIPVLRTNYFEELLKEGTEDEQKNAYVRLRANLQGHISSVDQQLLTLRSLAVGIDQTGFVSALEETLEGLKEHLLQQQDVVDIFERQDFRYQGDYISDMALTLGSVDTFLKSNAVKQIKPSTKEGKAIKALKEFTSKVEIPTDPRELRPTIVADLKTAKDHMAECAEAAGLKHKYKKQLTEDRMQMAWPTIIQTIPARLGSRTALVESWNQPLEETFGRPGCVPSTAQNVADRPCNAWGHTLQPHDGKGTLVKFVRSAVPTPYELKKGKSTKQSGATEKTKLQWQEQRLVGAREKAKQQLIDGLLMEVGGDVGQLEAICGKPEKAAICPMLPISYLTTDLTRHYSGKHDDEFTMHLEALAGFTALISKPDEIKEIEFKDKNGQQRKIYLKPSVAPVSCACNSLAFKFDAVTFPWGLSDDLNRLSVEDVTGSELPEDPIGGWAGEYLEAFERKHKRPHPLTEDIKKLVDEWRIMLLLEEHHSQGNDTFKAGDFPAAISLMLREDHPLVIEDIEKATELQDVDLTDVDAVSDEPYRFPIQLFLFCKSGKDRTGAGSAALDRFMTEHYLSKLTSVVEPLFSKDRLYNAQNFSIFVQLKIQYLNGALAYKTGGEQVGETVSKGRKHSSKTTVIQEEVPGKKKKKKGTTKKK